MAVAVKVTAMPLQMFLPVLAVTVRVGTILGFTENTSALLFTGLLTRQPAVLVIIHHTLSPLASEASLYLLLLIPTAVLSLYHWYTGMLPPFMGLAVKVTAVPPQIAGPAVAVMVTPAFTGVQVAKVKPALAPVPVGVVTLTLPVVPVPTTAVILVSESTLNDAAEVLPKLTTVAPVKLVPVIVTVAPLAAEAGVKDIIAGADFIKVNPDSELLPSGANTWTEPDLPAPTTAVILVAEITVKDFASTPPKFTEVTPVKSVPVIVTTVPCVADVGTKDVMAGEG